MTPVAVSHDADSSLEHAPARLGFLYWDVALRQRFGGKKKSQGRTPGAWAARNAGRSGRRGAGFRRAARSTRPTVLADTLEPFMASRPESTSGRSRTWPIAIDRLTATMGYAAVPASYLRHVIRAAERFGLDPRDIIVELGCRRAVVGQEDVVVQIAADMAGR